MLYLSSCAVLWAILHSSSSYLRGFF
jgi:hypothetical protein